MYIFSEIYKFVYFHKKFSVATTDVLDLYKKKI